MKRARQMRGTVGGRDRYAFASVVVVVVVVSRSRGNKYKNTFPAQERSIQSTISYSGWMEEGLELPFNLLDYWTAVVRDA